jgi:benzylsuccinate CoA-transferase BbsF subunit
MNAGKLSLALNLAKPVSRDIFHDLVRWADVVTESFSPGVMRSWGYDYEHLREINPSLIMLSSTLMGQTGPLGNLAGYGNLAAAISGFTNITGWPDRRPAGPYGAYSDYVSPRFGLAVFLAALDHRRRTGHGQSIDLSQAEASIHFLAPAIVKHAVDGEVLERRGNADVDMAPHGVYPCAGSEAWVALACVTDDDWGSLCSLMGRADLAADSRLTAAAGRIVRAVEVDSAVTEWTQLLTAEEVTRRCVEVGVAAHAAYGSAECAADLQLRHREHLVQVEHEMFGTVTVEAPRVRMSRTPGRAGAVPVLGQNTWTILSQILRYDDQRIADLYASEALE